MSQPANTTGSRTARRRRGREICVGATTPTAAVRTLRSRPGSGLIDPRHEPSQPADTAPTDTPERWVTKQQLAEHLQVTRRWIEYQQQRGLPHLRLGSINRYRVREVEVWLRERYASPAQSRSE